MPLLHDFLLCKTSNEVYTTVICNTVTNVLLLSSTTTRTGPAHEAVWAKPWDPNWHGWHGSQDPNQHLMINILDIVTLIIVLSATFFAKDVIGFMAQARKSFHNHKETYLIRCNICHCLFEYVLPQRPTPKAGWQLQPAASWEWGQRPGWCERVSTYSFTWLPPYNIWILWFCWPCWVSKYSQPALRQNVSYTICIHWASPHPQHNSYLWGEHNKRPW